MSKLLKGVFGAVPRLMLNLRLPTKLGLMGLLLTIPLLLMAASQYRILRGEQITAISERDGAALIEAWLRVAHGLQKHRTLTARAQRGDRSAEPPLAQARQALLADLASLDARSGSDLAFELPSEWATIRDRARALAEGRHATARDAAFDEHTQAIHQIGQLKFQIAERSLLLLDPVAETYFLMSLAVDHLLPVAEAFSVAAAQGSAILVRGDANTRERTRLLMLADGILRSQEAIEQRMGALRRAGGQEPAPWAAARDSALRFADLTQTIFGAEVIDADAERFSALGIGALEAVESVGAIVTTELSNKLMDRASAAASMLWLQMAVAVTAVVAVLVLAWAFYISFYGSLKALHKTVSTLAAGDLSHKMLIRGRDEMADIGRLVEGMSQRLSAMVSEIRSSAVRVGMAGRTLADGSGALARRTETQADSVRQTLNAALSLTSAVSSNAAAAVALDKLTTRLRTEAEDGGRLMRETVQAMNQLESSSRRVGEIVAVIDSIAFQTNILALNAAVEAARAGDSGRGFAVVATEVRQLAQRSAAAAGEIRRLIAQSGEQVQGSVARIHNVGAVLDGLVAGVRDASDSLREIAAASATQSTELEQVTQGVSSLDGITRENADMVTQSAVASVALVDRAARLATAVNSMRLRQGSADEAQALVDRALPLLRRVGLQGARQELQSTHSGFVDRDLYIFVIDRRGVYRLHGAKPAMEGQRVHDVPGIDGDRFLRDAWTVVQAGGGWIDYDIMSPDTGKVLPKTSVVVGLDAEMFVGCGVYRHVEAVAPATTQT